MKSSSDAPYSVSFRPNGTALVLDRHGQRCLDFEGPTHGDTIALLRFAGYNYEALVRDGTEPSSYPVRR